MGKFTGESSYAVQVPIKLNKFSLEDQLFNPFAYDSEETFYFSHTLELSQDSTAIDLKKLERDILEGKPNSLDQLLGLTIQFDMTGFIQVQKRTMYTFWNLIENVGGFHDGLYIICSIIMTYYSAAAFKADYISRSYVDMPASDRESARAKAPVSRVNPSTVEMHVYDT